MSIEIAQKKVALPYHQKEAAIYLKAANKWFNLGYMAYGKELLRHWSAHMNYCKRLKREIAEAEGHHKAKEVAFNGKFTPKSK